MSESVPGFHDEDASSDENDGVVGESARITSTTLRELTVEITQLINHQIDKAMSEKATYNAPIEGDRFVRDLFKTFLPLSIQREVYMKSFRTLEHASRSVCIFGAPPYPFLNSSDNGMLNASGMARRRVNIAYTHNGLQNLMHSQHFGRGQAYDEKGRLYKNIQGDLVSVNATNVLEQSNNMPIGMLALNNDDSTNAILVCKVRMPRNIVQSKEIIGFPKIGETIVLYATSYSRSIFRTNFQIEICIKGMTIPRRNSRMALLRVQCLRFSTV